jgi:long-chain acyl-CoA synthetase
MPQTEFMIVDPETRAPLRFRERGLVLVHGPQVMQGYLGKPEATAKVLDVDGWFDTGDLGMLLPDGSVVLTGRAKDTIVLSSGENIEPGPLEAHLLMNPVVEQVLLVGQDKKQLGALIVPSQDGLLQLAKNKGFEDIDSLLVGYGKVKLLNLLKKEFNRDLQSRLGSRADERLYAIAFVESFTIENGLLTQTLKQKRGKICTRDEKLIKEIYGQ